MSSLASNFRALVDSVVQRDNTFVLSVDYFFFGLGKVDLCFLASSGGRYEEADKAVPLFSNLAALSSINLSTKPLDRINHMSALISSDFAIKKIRRNLGVITETLYENDIKARPQSYS